MIKDWIRILGILLLTGMLVMGCTEYDLAQMTNVGDKEVRVALPFGSKAHKEISVTTRGTYDLHYESMVRNMYVFLFADGKKVYGRYFDAEDLDQTRNKEYWEVQNMSSDGASAQTHGTLHLYVPTVSGDGAEIVLVANIDLDFMNLSEDRLGLVRNREELNALMVSLNQDLPERNAGYFMMTGSQGGVSIYEDGTVSIAGGRIMLDRLDAKVEVNVRVNPTDQSNNQRVEDFTPKSWQVMNMPRTCLLMPSNGVVEPSEEGFFNTQPKNFETSENEVVNGIATGAMLYGFSFYTLENMQSANSKKSVGGNYHNRDRRIKYTDNPGAENYGQYNPDGGMWEYAPEQATYLVLNGELKMLVDPGQTTEQHLVADVTYVVHLGDFANNKDNYDITRNTHYKYTINIRGVDNIEVEVKTSNDGTDGVVENQPGAMGNVYTVEEEVYTFDAHYGQRVYTFPVSSINADVTTWYVKTPFGREGIPVKDQLTGQEIYNDLDYKWVQFCINDLESDGTYSLRNKPYPGTGHASLMDVVQFVAFLKAEKTKYESNQENAFDRNGDLKVTVFVNEFYYEVDPMNPNNKPKDLWKRFVNQPSRLMHIFGESAFSKDGDSSITGSIVTIQQHSIQTPYNINMSRTDLDQAWGCETADETNNTAWFYHPDERMNSGSAYKITSYTPDNTSKSDGLYNTACLLNLVRGTGTGKTVNTNLRWDTFIDYSGMEPQLKGNYRAGLYSVFLRNRDLDGDGIVDPEELRWYIASLDQLCGLFLGDQGLSSESQLYPIEASREPNAPVSGGAFDGVYPWRLHVVSSTANGQVAGNMPVIVWAEEGASTGEYQSHYSKPAYSPVRCVRNLGMELPSSSSIVTAGMNYPDDELVIVEETTGAINANSVYRFNFRNMNEESLRYYTTRELVPGDEYSVMSRLYYGFETGPLHTSYPIGSNSSPYIALKGNLENGITHAPEAGYRIPNIREGVVMQLYCGSNTNWWGSSGSLVSSYYSFGYYGNQYDRSGNSHFYSWFIYRDRVTLGSVGESINRVRYVKDWRP